MSNRTKAVELTRTLLNEHGLGHVKVEISSKARRKAGSCHYRFGQASMIRYAEWLLQPDVPWEHVENTVRHEVAHAIVGPGKGHGREWKTAAKSIGCTGDRCYSRELGEHAPKARYVADCKCGESHHTRHRLKNKKTMMNGTYACGGCRTPLYFIENKEEK